MCNLYRVKKSVAEIADLFRVEAASGGNVPEEIYPGMPGWVVAGGQLRSMAWGFPFSQRGAKGQMLKPRPVNNARTDKLDSFFWRYSFEERRCIIPVSAFAEAIPVVAPCRILKSGSRSSTRTARPWNCVVSRIPSASKDTNSSKEWPTSYRSSL